MSAHVSLKDRKPTPLSASAPKMLSKSRVDERPDAVGIALVNNLGFLPAQVTNFLEDAAQGTAVYSVALASQPVPAPFNTAPISIQLVGAAALVDHLIA